MNKPWKVIVAFLGVFVFGAVFGGFLSLRMAPRFIDNARPRGPAPLEQFSPQMFKRLADRLELTAEQKEKIRPILRQTEEEMRKVRQSGMRESMAVADRMHDQVAALLTAEQKTKLETLKRELRERWNKDRQRRMGERPPGAPGPRDEGAPPPERPEPAPTRS